VTAYKFLASGAVGPFSGFRWPGPGAWVEVAGPLEPCRRGIHAPATDALSEWLSDELWNVELAGELVRADGLVVAERGCLVDRVESWNAGAALEFARACAERLRERASADERFVPFADDAELQLELAADPKLTAVVAFIARHAAEEAEPGGWAAERAWQSGLLAERLGL
jgi:hypothetical protein